jgi:phage terminase large subunit
MSSEYDIAYVQEAIELTEDDWEAVTTRLRNGVSSFQQLIGDTNPGPPHHWLNTRCTRGQATMITTRHEDNPRLYDAATGTWTAEGQAYLKILEGLTGVRYLRLRKGIWAAAEGLVYENFDPAVHFHKPVLLPPKEWTRYLSVDFGFRNPFVCQFWAQDHDGRLYLYRELYGTGTLVEDWARLIRKALHDGDGYGHPDELPRTVICDHDAEDRATLERHLDMGTAPAIKSVSDGIQAVQARLKVRADGRPGLYICRDALVSRDPVLEEARKPLCTADEVLEYVWDPSVPRLAGDTFKEAPLKQNDHGMDSLRYMVAHLDLQGRPGIRFLGGQMPRRL